MTDKQLKAFGAVLIVIVALVALARWNAARPTSTAVAPVDLKSLKDSPIDKIVLESQEGSVTLAKTSAGWSVGTSTADTEAVTKFWKTIEAATFNEIVSTNPENQATFGVSGPTVRKYAFFEGDKKKAELIIGSTTDAPGAFYVKVAGRKDVWSVTAPFDTIPTAADAWKAKAPPKPAKTPKK